MDIPAGLFDAWQAWEMTSVGGISLFRATKTVSLGYRYSFCLPE